MGCPPQVEGGPRDNFYKACGEYTDQPAAARAASRAVCCCALGWTRPLLRQRPFPWRRGVPLRQGQSPRPGQSRRPYSTRVVRHLSKTPLGGKTPSKTKIPAWLPSAHHRMCLIAKPLYTHTPGTTLRAGGVSPARTCDASGGGRQPRRRARAARDLHAMCVDFPVFHIICGPWGLGPTKSYPFLSRKRLPIFSGPLGFDLAGLARPVQKNNPKFSRT